VSIAIVTCMFNPCGYERRNTNYLRFLAAARNTRAVIYCVELLFPRQLPVCEADHKIVLETESILWHKEALLNIGIKQAIADGHEFIAWADADIVLHPQAFHSNFISSFDDTMIGHATARIRTNWPDDRQPLVRRSVVEVGMKGHTGGCWVARAGFWATRPLFDYGIIGGGDHMNWLGYRKGYNMTRIPHCCEVSRSIRRKWNSWMEKLPAVRAVHNGRSSSMLPHGSRQNRQYRPRYARVAQVDLDKDLIRRADGLLEWAGESSVRDDVEDYFMSRREDD